MKTIFTILIFLSLTMSGLAWPFGKKKDIKPTPTPALAVSPTPKSVAKPTIQDSRELVREIAVELKSAKEENQRLKSTLNRATEQVKIAEQRTLDVQKQADALKEWGIIQQQQAHKFMEKYNSAVKRYHRLKLIAALIAAAAGVFVGLQFMNLVPPPYNFGVPVGGAILFSTLVWLLL